MMIIIIVISRSRVPHKIMTQIFPPHLSLSTLGAPRKNIEMELEGQFSTSFAFFVCARLLLRLGV